MNFYMNSKDKPMAKLHGMLKTVEESIKKNPNYVMMVQKEKKMRKSWMPAHLSLREKEILALLLSRNAFNVIRRDIGSEIVRST
jgi:hypothetical protein